MNSDKKTNKIFWKIEQFRKYFKKNVLEVKNELDSCRNATKSRKNIINLETNVKQSFNKKSNKVESKMKK